MWQDIWDKHKGKCIGVAAGIFFGFIYLICGFWEMLVFLLLVMIGFYIGRKSDQGEAWLDISRLYRWLTERWNLFR